MLVRLLLLALVCQSHALLFSYIPGVSYFFPPDPDQSPAQRWDAPDHQADHHPHYEDCFDERIEYGEVQYNITTTQHCTYSLDRICYPRSQVLCLEVPTSECKLEAGYTCKTHEEYNTLRCDTTVTKKITVRDCVQDRFESLMKVLKTPECKNVTKVNCDSQWIINEFGQKVFDKNMNCRDVTWEKCELVDKVVSEGQVPVYTCTDREETYLVPEVIEEAVTSYRKKCDPMGGAVCEVSMGEECTTVEWTDCEEVIRPHCETLTLKIPFQEETKYHRCHVDKNTGNQQIQEDHHKPKPMTEDHQPEQIKEDHPHPEQINEEHHQPEQINEEHHHPEQINEEHHHPEQINEDHLHPEHLQPEQMNYYHHQPLPAQLGHHPGTEYHPQPVTGYHHPSLPMPYISY